MIRMSDEWYNPREVSFKPGQLWEARSAADVGRPWRYFIFVIRTGNDNITYLCNGIHTTQRKFYAYAEWKVRLIGDTHE